MSSSSGLSLRAPQASHSYGCRDLYCGWYLLLRKDQAAIVTMIGETEKLHRATKYFATATYYSCHCSRSVVRGAGHGSTSARVRPTNYLFLRRRFVGLLIVGDAWFPTDPSAKAIKTHIQIFCKRRLGICALATSDGGAGVAVEFLTRGTILKE
jgi:hypothetical protein